MVTQTFERTASVVVDIRVADATITATPEYPFWVIGAGWTAAGELRRGSALLTKDGVVVHVDTIERREGKFKIYNFEVGKAHTYYVSKLGVLVHNKCHGHHSDPKYLGPNPNQPLTRMPDTTHRQLHRDMNNFMRNRTKSAGNDMAHRRGNLVKLFVRTSHDKSGSTHFGTSTISTEADILQPLVTFSINIKVDHESGGI